MKLKQTYFRNCSFLPHGFSSFWRGLQETIIIVVTPNKTKPTIWFDTQQEGMRCLLKLNLRCVSLQQENVKHKMDIMYVYSIVNLPYFF